MYKKKEKYILYTFGSVVRYTGHSRWCPKRCGGSNTAHGKYTRWCVLTFAWIPLQGFFVHVYMLNSRVLVHMSEIPIKNDSICALLASAVLALSVHVPMVGCSIGFAEKRRSPYTHTHTHT